MTGQGNSLTYVVNGMDCASCTAKVEKLVAAVPGTQEVKTSFIKQTLTLELDETQTSRQQLEASLQSMGYTPSLVVAATGQHADHPHDHAGHGAEHGAEHGHGHSQGHSHSHADPEDRGKPWYQTKQGKLVLGSGLLLALAWLLGFVAPQWARWGYAVATLLGALPLARKAWASARLGDPFSINMLVTLAALGAVAIGQAAEGAVVVALFAVGELLEGVAAGRARAGIQALAALTPKLALLREGESTREVPAETLQPGQVVQVNPGARVPADGTILSGFSSLDDSPVTGESVPVEKAAGDPVYAGSINAGGVLNIRVDKAAHDNTIARIIEMVEEAEGSKASAARFIDRFSRWYTPGVVLAAALCATLPPLLLHQAWYPWLYKGMALLLIGCPCALVLSVPAAITSGISAGTRRGLLIKGGAALERMGRVKTVAFDKTGTLTVGKPRVTGVVGEHAAVLRLAAAAESGSSHPLARAIVEAASAEGITVPAASEAQALPGQGVSAQVEGRAVLVTSPKYAASHAALSGDLARAIEDFEAQGHTVVVVLDANTPAGVVAMRDEPREDARQGILALQRLGVRSLMLTGDHARAGAGVASDLGLEVRAELLPEDKLGIIAELRNAGGVAMVGDGINDAPALAQADVGIAMGGGTDVALETADAALLRGRVQGVGELIELSRATMGNIRQNIAFALGLKLLFLATTLLGYTNLWMAVLADTGATALVTANALRLLRWRPQHA